MNTINETNYIELAQEVMKKLQKPNRRNPDRLEFNFKTTQIRKLLSMTANISDQVKAMKDSTLPQDILSKVNNLHIQIVYQAGRKSEVKEFVEKAKLLEIIKEIGNNRENLLLFCRYMEALVAYHRFLGGEN